jgi:foldase protein PrsA
MKKSKIINLLIVIFICATYLLSGCNIEDKPYSETVVLKVDDEKVYMDEMLYHVMLAEMQGQLYASFIGDEESYWDIKNEDGSTMKEAMKDLAMENAIRYEIFFKLALKAGYSLTEEEKEISQSKVDNILLNVSADQFNLTELTEIKLLEIQNKIALATKYYDDYVSNLGVDEDAIRAKFKTEDYKQYDIQYIFATEEEYEELQGLVEEIKEVEDITTITKDTNLNSGKLSFLEGAGTFGEEVNLEEVIKTMSVGQVSDVIETSKGYYIVKLNDNTSTKEYDSAIKEAISKEVTKAFDKAYSILKKEHKITIEKKVWKQIEMGDTIIKS